MKKIKFIYLILFALLGLSVTVSAQSDNTPMVTKEAYNRLNKALIESQKSNTELEKSKSQLEQEYYKAILLLKDMRTMTTELNEMIDTQKQALEERKETIISQLATKQDLIAVKSELQRLKASADEYLAELAKCRQAKTGKQ